MLKDDGIILIEVPNCDDALLSLYKSKEFADYTYWMCHLYLFNGDTLRNTVEKAGYKINFLKQIQRYPLSNTLYWLSCGKPGGHSEWNMMNEDPLNQLYGDMLARIGRADTLICECSKK